MRTLPGNRRDESNTVKLRKVSDPVDGKPTATGGARPKLSHGLPLATPSIYRIAWPDAANAALRYLL